MSLDIPTADHTCNVVRRQVQEKFPDLTLLYFVYQPGEKLKGLETKRVELLEHPAGEDFLPLLRKQAEEIGPELCGISIKLEKKFLSFKTQEKILACFFINAQSMESADDMRRHALALAWQALTLLEEFKSAKIDRFQEIGGIIMPRRDETTSAWKNMLGDAYAVLAMEIEKRKDYIGALGRKLSLAAVTANGKTMPGSRPFPIILDATRLVYNDMLKRQETGEPLKRALEMTREIGETFDRESIRQWWAFTGPAQIMAWMGADKSAILGAAAYGSEDPNARATAYLIADALNIQTLQPAPVGIFNPFSNLEDNERHHLKACDDAFSYLMSRIVAGNVSEIIRNEIERQNTRLLKGNPLGWCGYGFMAVDEAAKETKGREALRTAFDTALAAAPWQKVTEVIDVIIQLRRQGVEVTPGILAVRIQGMADLKFLTDCFIK